MTLGGAFFGATQQSDGRSVGHSFLTERGWRLGGASQ
jgi:hypothetical protein